MDPTSLLRRSKTLSSLFLLFTLPWFLYRWVPVHECVFWCWVHRYIVSMVFFSHGLLCCETLPVGPEWGIDHNKCHICSHFHFPHGADLSRQGAVGETPAHFHSIPNTGNILRLFCGFKRKKKRFRRDFRACWNLLGLKWQCLRFYLSVSLCSFLFLSFCYFLWVKEFLLFKLKRQNVQCIKHLGQGSSTGYWSFIFIVGHNGL